MKLRDKPSTIKTLEASKSKAEALEKLGITRQALDQWLKYHGLTVVIVKDTKLKVEKR